jgi:hypothetical protein
MENTVTVTPFHILDQLDRLSEAVAQCDLAEGDRESIQHKACDIASLLLDNMDPTSAARLVAEVRFEAIRRRTLGKRRPRR